MPLKNRVYRVEIQEFNNLGFGVARIDGQVVFVRGAVDGDVADVKIVKVNKTWSAAITEKIVVPSKHRITQECGCSEKCGGCAYGMISYEHELQLKTAHVRRAFDANGIKNVSVHDVINTGITKRYRNKAEYAVKNENGEVKIGFYAPKSHRIAGVTDCLLHPEIFEKILKAVEGYIKKSKISIYDEKTVKGLLRHIYLRQGTLFGISLCLVVNGNTIPEQDMLIDTIKKELPEVTGIVLNINKENSNVILGDEYVTLWGDPIIREELGSVPLEVSPAAFLQVNKKAAELLYAKAKELLGEDTQLLLDLYCGTGSIGLSMADKVKKLVGIEINPDAVENAKRNAEAAGIKNARFYASDASDFYSLLTEEEKAMKVTVVIDPPRKGCSEKVISDITALSPEKIIYISCNPETLTRDIRRLSEKNYACKDVFPVDMFPRTGHVETVVLMSRVEK